MKRIIVGAALSLLATVAQAEVMYSTKGYTIEKNASTNSCSIFRSSNDGKVTIEYEWSRNTPAAVITYGLAESLPNRQSAVGNPIAFDLKKTGEIVLISATYIKTSIIETHTPDDRNNTTTVYVALITGYPFDVHVISENKKVTFPEIEVDRNIVMQYEKCIEDINGNQE